MIRQYIIKEGSSSLLLGIPTKYFCLAATAAVMHHIEETRHATFLNHSVQFKYQISNESMIIDCTTARNLELSTNLSSRNDKETLFGVLNETVTPMGARRLRCNILEPCKDEKTINTRLDCVEELSQVEETFYVLRTSLKAFNDVDHLITSFIQVPTKPSIKHSEQIINNIISLKHTLRSIAVVAEPLRTCQNKLLKTIYRILTDPRLAGFLNLIDNVIEQNVVQEKTAVGLRNQRCFAVKAGCNGLLDVARQTYKETINDIFEVVNRYVEEFNISLKVQFNTTMGYYLSTSVDQLEGGELPLIFINVVKKSKTMTFTTLELVKKNAKINDSLTEVYLMSDNIVNELSSDIRADIGAVYKASEALAMLDMLLSFAHLHMISDYVRPDFADTLVIKQGRHPVIEKLYSIPVVPNDTYAGPASTFQVITGPNMSGKSTYLRQVALLIIMAQIGSFIPAEYAAIRIIDQLFTRISNDDSIELNASTFTLEMKETAYIVQNVTERSIVIIDELGRGTSTHDGLGIAFAVCEELIHARALVFFATHFQELASSLMAYHNVVNLHLETEITRDNRDTPGIVYKYILTSGSAKEEHYGLSLAKTMNLSIDITDRAEQVSRELAELQEKACRQSESSRVIARRRTLSQIAHHIVLIQKSSKRLSRQKLTLVLQRAQQEAIAMMLAIRGRCNELDQAQIHLFFAHSLHPIQQVASASCMAYLSDFVKSTLSRVVLGKEIPSFPYTIGDRVDSFDSTIWALHKGIKREDNSQVSILCFDCVRQKDKLPLARNAFKKFRTIRHPDLIKYIDGVETESYIYIVTDAVTPLQDHLRADLDINLIRWGLYKVANVLKFLTVDASFIHGNVRTSSIFITKSGEWKVGGFELLSSLKEDQPAILTFAGLIPESNRYAPPEVRKKSWNVVKEYELWSTDTWHYACLIYEVFNGPFTSPEQLATPGKIPPDIGPFYKNLLRPDPKTRPSVGDFLDKGLQAKGFFQNDLIQVVLFLENFSVKEPLERDTFLRKLDLQVDRFPQEFCRYKVLPDLVHALEYGSGGAKVLPPIVKIGTMLDDQEYETLIGNILVKMFASTDRTIRLSLLENLGGFIERINKKVVNDKIFPSMALGFTDTAPIIREWTVKSVLLVINKLSDKVINYDLLRYLGKLQTDEEPGIRTNTVICLGKIAKHLNDATKGKILVPAFTRSLRDPFAHARVASLMALNATSESYDKNDIATRIIPCISLTLVDTEKIVRVQAMRSMDTFTKRIEKLVESMPDSAIVDTGRDSPNGPPRSTTPSTSSSSETWAGWAVSSITKKLATGDMQPQAVGSPQAGNSNAPSPTNTPAPAASSNGMSLSSSSAGLKVATESENGRRLGDGYSVNRYSSALAAVEADESASGGGWGNEDEGLFDNEGFEPMEEFEPSTSSPAPNLAPKHMTMSASRPSTSAGSSMSLGGGSTKGPSRLGFGAMDDGGTDAWDGDDDLFKSLNLSNNNNSGRPLSSSTTTAGGAIPASGFIRKEEKMAELARKREERRLRMAEAKERKKESSPLGAKKI
ncbi:hypothetical protein BGZ80_007059 [Entomortierella chlamydospora]|uniref:DNA mismatch repair protein MSH3 n=1 Tax=Entomortierella chlamydospora TaxID=101097 RepID=A0A9P6MZT9_9FUNG|nr:hypothetical protein BGZ80_007059 [Entomortierella chlamydospora]